MHFLRISPRKVFNQKILGAQKNLLLESPFESYGNIKW